MISGAARLGQAASSSLSRLSGGLIAATVALCLVAGAIAGWTMRNPDVMAVPVEPTVALPVLWVEPAWNAVVRHSSAEEQLHYALLQAPPDERVAAFLAVPGFFPHSHDQVSKAYTQLARIWYRRGDVDCARRRSNPSSRPGSLPRRMNRNLSQSCVLPSNCGRPTLTA